MLLIGRERGKGTNRENPRTIPEQIGKILENRERTKKDKKGQKRTKKEGQVQIGKHPCLKPPRLAALDLRGVFRGLCGSAALSGVLQGSTGFSEGSGPMLATLRSCWSDHYGVPGSFHVLDSDAILM